MSESHKLIGKTLIPGSSPHPTPDSLKGWTQRPVLSPRPAPVSVLPSLHRRAEAVVWQLSVLCILTWTSKNWQKSKERNLGHCPYWVYSPRLLQSSEPSLYLHDSIVLFLSCGHSLHTGLAVRKSPEFHAVKVCVMSFGSLQWSAECPEQSKYGLLWNDFIKLFSLVVKLSFHLRLCFIPNFKIPHWNISTRYILYVPIQV